MTIRFDGIFINEGNAYNNITGVYTVPQDGVYMLSFFIETHFAKEIHAQLLVDGTHIADAVVEPTEEHNDVMSGNLVIKRLLKGQSVCVADNNLYEDEAHTLVSENRFKACTFSGVLLF